MVVALLGPRQVPVPLDFFPDNLLCNRPRFAVREIGPGDALLVRLEFGARVRRRQGPLQVVFDRYVERGRLDHVDEIF